MLRRRVSKAQRRGTRFSGGVRREYAQSAAGAQLNKPGIRVLDAPEGRIVAILTDRTGCGRLSVDVDGRPDGNDVEQRLDVLVPKPNAAVTDRSANGLRIVSPVKGIAIAEVEAEGSENALELALPGHNLTNRRFGD